MVSMAFLDSEPLAALGAATGEDGTATLGCHASAEAVGLGTLPLVRLICTLHVCSYMNIERRTNSVKPQNCRGLCSKMSIFSQLGPTIHFSCVFLYSKSRENDGEIPYTF